LRIPLYLLPSRFISILHDDACGNTNAHPNQSPAPYGNSRFTIIENKSWSMPEVAVQEGRDKKDARGSANRNRQELASTRAIQPCHIHGKIADSHDRPASDETARYQIEDEAISAVNVTHDQFK